MSFTFKGGGDVPKTVPFTQRYEVNSDSGIIEKGKIIELKGVKHQIMSIRTVEVMGDFIEIKGKAAPTKKKRWF